jgi:hypothetical protein
LTDLPRLAEMQQSPIVAMAALARLPNTAILELINQMFAGPIDANLFMSQFQLFSIFGNRDFALEMQAKALEISSIYRIEGCSKPAIRLLALMCVGDPTDNTPLDYLIEDADIRLDLLYIVPGHPLPASIPDHDVAIVAPGASAGSTLEIIDRLIANWPRPVLNPPGQILLCSRERLYQNLQSIPGLAIPPTLRAGRQDLAKIATLELPVEKLTGEHGYPITVRPVDSQSGRNLARIENAAQLATYLEASSAQDFFVSLYIDYRSADGHYRKARIALIDDQPFICHLAIGDSWIVHYNSAGMMDSAFKRAEEELFMQQFDAGFAVRHGDALRAIAQRLKLDYVVLDCAETSAGELLLFEADNRGWVHATDPVDIFPYKQAAMKKVFAAFRAMLLQAMNTSLIKTSDRTKQ